MGDPKFLRRTYDRPKHPWEAVRIQDENKLVVKFGLKNKKELWKAQSRLRNYRRQARELQARLRAKEPQAEKETKWLLESLTHIGLLNPGNVTIDDVLALNTQSLLERRLQWLVYVKGLATSPKAARQLIVHGHVSLGNHKVRAPGYTVKREEESLIMYNAFSPISGDTHPMRIAMREKQEKQGMAQPPAPATPVAG
jgi:small subunit ribosomal protein S4